MVQLFADFKELHGSSPAAIVASANDPQSSGQALIDLSDDLIHDARKTRGSTEGDISEISTAPQHGAKMCRSLGALGLVAAGCLRKFGSSAQDFDTSVHQLNHRIQSAQDSDTVRHSLAGDYKRLVATLDADARTVAGMLKHPSDLGNVKQLIDEGFIPLSAAPTWPGVQTMADPQKVKKALKSIRDVIDDRHWLTRGAKPAYDALVGLNAAEVRAVMAQLNDDDLDNLNSAFVWWQPKNGYPDALPLGGIPTHDKIALSNVLLPALGATALRRVMKHLSSLQPSYGGTEGAGNADQQGMHWAWPSAGGVPTRGGVDDLNQGDLSDCWFLSSLGAEVRQNPDFPGQHIADNGNGTYSVTLYDHGEPVTVTVDGQLPHNGWGSTAFAHDPNGNGGWVQIYEKAFAQLNGGYANIEGGWGDDGMSAVTGHHTERHGDEDYSTRDLGRLVTSGHAVTVGSDTHHSGFLWHHSDEYFPSDPSVVTAHEYVVDHVEPDGDVVLRNPWGPGAPVDDTITISEDEFHRLFREVSVDDE